MGKKCLQTAAKHEHTKAALKEKCKQKAKTGMANRNARKSMWPIPAFLPSFFFSLPPFHFERSIDRLLR